MAENQTLTAFIGKEVIKMSVQAKETKLKGYSKFRFFCFKAGKHWHICEWTSGREVSTGFNTTLATAKKSAREYLLRNSNGDMSVIENAIDEKERVN
jgi:hypothetical protein